MEELNIADKKSALHNDLALVAKCRKGDNNAYKAIYDKYAPLMLSIATRYMKDRDAAEDVLQEAFIKAFSNIKSYSGSGSFEGWLRRILINTAITAYHKAGQTVLLDNEIPHENLISEHSAAISALSAEELIEVINQLPPGYKMVFNLYAIEGYKHIEIAEMLNITEGTSKSQLAKARKMLIGMLAEKNIMRYE